MFRDFCFLKFRRATEKNSPDVNGYIPISDYHHMMDILQT